MVSFHHPYPSTIWGVFLCLNHLDCENHLRWEWSTPPPRKWPWLYDISVKGNLLMFHDNQRPDKLKEPINTWVPEMKPFLSREQWDFYLWSSHEQLRLLVILVFLVETQVLLLVLVLENEFLLSLQLNNWLLSWSRHFPSSYFYHYLSRAGDVGGPACSNYKTLILISYLEQLKLVV